ncbi:MAG: hypothetical protein HYX39_00185 [Bacteroidetes bacterium]|nr:hypothetical protein [Bacteroidota bacterium]
MKKILLIAAVAGLSMVSCKKDRVCTCTETESAGGPSSTSTTTIVKSSKMQAKANCVSTKSTNNGNTHSSDCKLN